MKIFDPIHGTDIELSDSATAIVKTRHFQRLSRVYQLAPIQWIYPSANHTRLAHSIGVSHLSKKFIIHLLDNCEELKHLNVKKYSTIVEIAGLCHDIGHGPFSHLFESVIRQISPDKPFHHESCSTALINDMIKVYGLEEVFFADCGIVKRDIELIKFLILGQKTEYFQMYPEASRKEEAFLFEIISNDKCGLDTDRWDYLMRDTRVLPVSKRFDSQEIRRIARIVFKDEESCVAYSLKNINSVLEVFRMREYMHTNFYSALNSKALHYMLTEALCLASDEPYLFGKKIRALSDISDDYLLVLDLTDDKMLNLIELSESPNEKVQEAKRIIRRIQEMDTYKDMISYEVNHAFNFEKFDSDLRKDSYFADKIFALDLNYTNFFMKDSKFDSIVFYEEIPSIFTDTPLESSDLSPNKLLPININFSRTDNLIPYNNTKRIISIQSRKSAFRDEEKSLFLRKIQEIYENN
ncbi:MAG: hypothetical protein MHMPM18_002829 [Marteilia pararefringens]